MNLCGEHESEIAYESQFCPAANDGRGRYGCLGSWVSLAMRRMMSASIGCLRFGEGHFVSSNDSFQRTKCF